MAKRGTPFSPRRSKSHNASSPSRSPDAHYYRREVNSHDRHHSKTPRRSPSRSSPSRSPSQSRSPAASPRSGEYNRRSKNHSPSTSPAPGDRVPIVPAKDLLPDAMASSDRAQLRIVLKDEDKNWFEKLAKGTLSTKNSDWLDKVARVDSVANRAPYLQRDFRHGEGQLKLREQSLIEHHDLLYRTLGVSSLIGNMDHDQTQVKNCIGSLLSMMVHQVTVWRRWMALDNLTISRQAIPGSSSMLLDLKEHKTCDGPLSGSATYRKQKQHYNKHKTQHSFAFSFALATPVPHLTKLFY
jgi:hypothetical protein